MITGQSMWNFFGGKAISELEGNADFINHVHISEPALKPIEQRTMHKELWALLNVEGYNGFVSVEMRKTSYMVLTDDIMRYSI